MNLPADIGAGIVGVDKLRAKAAAIRQHKESKAVCNNKVSEDNTLCFSWKVPVTIRECEACHSGNFKVKMDIASRSTSAGVLRHRNVKSCRHYGTVLATMMQPCCGGKLQPVDRFICTLSNSELVNSMCYACPNYVEVTDAPTPGN